MRLALMGETGTARGRGTGSEPREGLRLRTTGPAPQVEHDEHLVLGYDLAPASQRALSVAVDFARRLGAHLHVVHVVDLSDYPVDPDAADWEEHAQASLRREHDNVEAALRYHAGSWTYHAWYGDPIGLLARVADEHDALMIIVGTRGAGFGAALARLAGGSTSHGLLRRSDRPVLVVPARHDDENAPG
jgi:nucleotide-binding universal stress UspA family protein